MRNYPAGTFVKQTTSPSLGAKLREHLDRWMTAVKAAAERR
jgi:hypothetical protein